MNNESIDKADNFLKVAQGIVRLQDLNAIGLLDSDEADLIRDDLDAFYYELTKQEAERIRWLSVDLYDISESVVDRKVKDRNSQVNEKLAKAINLKKSARYDESLAVVRRWKEYLEYKDLNYLRGSIWLERGYPEIAVPFFREASRLEPDLSPLYLNVLEKVDKEAAIKYACSILDNYKNHHAFTVLSAESLVFEAVRLGDLEWGQGYASMLEILLYIKDEIRDKIADGLRRSARAMYSFQKALCHRQLGDPGSAVEELTSAIAEDPRNIGLRVSRGQLLVSLGDSKSMSDLALSDFEQACSRGAPMVDPYFFVAYDRLNKGKYSDCISICLHGLSLSPSKSFESKLYEMLAIARSQTIHTESEVMDCFERAILSDPLNKTALSNKLIYQDFLQSKSKGAPSFKLDSCISFTSNESFPNDFFNNSLAENLALQIVSAA